MAGLHSRAQTEKKRRGQQGKNGHHRIALFFLSFSYSFDTTHTLLVVPPSSSTFFFCTNPLFPRLFHSQPSFSSLFPSFAPPFAFLFLCYTPFFSFLLLLSRLNPNDQPHSFFFLLPYHLAYFYL
ncbi:hypothetical protein BC940DRAFT_130738 [Gongronella butleri]|nr:hypothetical protein BC940DRAFT_130738 [Gongronella butleri]